MKPPYEVNGAWHAPSKVDSRIVNATLKNLGSLYRKQGKLEAAEILEELRSGKGIAYGF